MSDPANTAAIDQGQMFARDAVRLFTNTARLLTATVGEQQSTANLVAHLATGEYTREALAVLAVTAFHELAKRAVSDAAH